MKKIDVPEQMWESLGVRDPKSIRMFKGVNTMDRYSIEPAFSPNSSNFTGSGFPSLKVRDGYTALSSTGTQLPAGRVLGMGLREDKELHVFVKSTTQNGANWYKRSGNTWDSLGQNLAQNNGSMPWSTCNFQGNFPSMCILATNGYDSLRYYEGTGALKDIPSCPTGANYIDQHDNRVYVAVKNSVHFSALRKATDWTTVDDAGQIVVETSSGEPINGLKAGNRHLLIFKEHSVHELWGTNPINYNMETVATDIGLINNQCVTTIQGVPYWMDTRGIYMYGGSRPRKDFSLPIKGYLDRLNVAQKQKCSVGSNGTQLYVSLPLDNSTEADTTLEYDPEFQTWYVWKNIQATCFANIGRDLYIGDTAGRVLKVGGTTDNGVAIPYSWESVPFGSGTMAQRLQWYRLWYVADIPVGSSMNVHLSRSAEGNSDWILVKSIAAGTNTTGRVMIPVDAVANSQFMRVRFSGTGPVKIMELDTQQRELPMY